MREACVGREHTVCEARQRLLGRVRMNGAERALVPRVQRLQQVERLQAPHLTDQDSIRPVSEGRTKEVCDGHGRQRRLLPQWGLRPSCLEPDEVRLVDQNLGRLFDQNDAVLGWDGRRERVQRHADDRFELRRP